jgi:hypothetical protein
MCAVHYQYKSVYGDEEEEMGEIRNHVLFHYKWSGGQKNTFGMDFIPRNLRAQLVSD